VSSAPGLIVSYYSKHTVSMECLYATEIQLNRLISCNFLYINVTISAADGYILGDTE
jgi:hypothetical protein